MKEVLLFGISELSERIAYYIDCGESVKPFVVKGFVIDDAYYKEETKLLYFVISSTQGKWRLAA